MEDQKNKQLYECSECGKIVGIVFVVKEGEKIKNKCTKCFYKKDEKRT